MKISPTLLVASLLASAASIAHAVPFYGWTEDYTGNEANTIALWKFDTAGGGVLSNSYSGSSYNKAALSLADSDTQTGVPGKFGEALAITSRSEAATAAWAYSASSSVVSSTQTLFNGPAMSIEFWYQPISISLGNGTVDNNLYFFDQKYTTLNGVSLTLRNNAADNVINGLHLSVGNGTKTVTLDTSSLSWSLETFYHIAVTFENVNGDGVMNIYRDGILLASGTSTGFGNAAAGSRRYRIGNRGASSYAPLPGLYDNFRISNVAYEYAVVPEPGTVGLLSASSILLAARWLRRKSAHA